MLPKFVSDVGVNIVATHRRGCQFFKSLMCLMSHGSTRADVKPGNTSLSEDCSTVKICDFGAAMIVNV